MVGEGKVGRNSSIDRFTGRRLMFPSTKLFGAKTRNRDILYHLFPRGFYYRFIDVFMGTGGVLLETPVGRKRRGCDINEDVINYYHVLQQSPEEFWDEFQVEMEELFEFGPDAADYGRECYEGYRNYLNTPDQDHKNYPVTWALCFYMMTKLGYNGLASRRNKKGKLNCPYCKQIRGRGFFTREWFDYIVNNIKDVEFQNWDFRHTLGRSQQSEFSFFFCDPPYRETAKKNKRQDYNGMEFTDDDHTELRDLLKWSRSQWMLTINDDDFTRELYKDFYVYPHENFAYSCSQTPEGRGKRPELLVTNYEIKEDLWKQVQQAVDAKPKRVPKVPRLLPDQREEAKAEEVQTEAGAV